MAPTLYEAEPYPGAPRYFARRWNDLVIVGYSCRSTFEEDWAVEDRAFDRGKGAFPAVCFSEAEREGEYGFVPLREAVPIKRWELEAMLASLGVPWLEPERPIPGEELAEPRVYRRWEDAMVEQLRLHEFIASHEGRHYMEVFERRMNAMHIPDERLADGFLHALQTMALHEAEPVYVSADICELVDHARESLELEPCRASDPFVPSGFCLLAKPLKLRDGPGLGDSAIMVRGIGWISIHTEDLADGAFWISFYCHFDDDPHHALWNGSEREYLGVRAAMMLGHTFQWTWGNRMSVAELVDGELQQDAQFRAREQASMIQTLWRLGQQFVSVKRRAPRPLRRDVKRKMRRELEDVHVVLLRRERTIYDETEETGRHVSVSFLVRGHWALRHTREGPRQVWIKPYIKGRGPFKKTRRAWEFRR
jgi:hypothetical protein